ncbi:MAG: L,D-transpeptidase [Chlorobiaceae bacterium]
MVNAFESIKKPFYRFMVLCVFVYSGTILASEKEERVPVLPAKIDSDSSATTKAVVTSPRFSSTVSSVTAPDGFILRMLKKGENLSTICKADSSCKSIFLKINRLDNRHFPIGKKVLVPVDISKAKLYVPVPETLIDSRGEREVRIFLDPQYFGAYANGRLLFWGPVSSGTKKRSTPPGRFFVNYKERFKRSHKYENAPMPFSINYHDGYFMHQQSLPGYPASHGCVRMLQEDAERLFFWTQLRDPVTLVKDR